MGTHHYNFKTNQYNYKLKNIFVQPDLDFKTEKYDFKTVNKLKSMISKLEIQFKNETTTFVKRGRAFKSVWVPMHVPIYIYIYIYIYMYVNMLYTLRVTSDLPRTRTYPDVSNCRPSPVGAPLGAVGRKPTLATIDVWEPGWLSAAGFH